MIDFHIHTCYSDGTDKPSEVVNKAIKLGLSYIAITDHDTIDGYLALNEEEKDGDLKVFPGIEIDTFYKEYSMHLLGYAKDKESIIKLKPLIEKIKKKRHIRNLGVIDNLNRININVRLDDFKDVPNVTLSHFANWLIEKGYAQNIREVFMKYFTKSFLEQIPFNRIDIIEAIQFFNKCNVKSVLAHPKLIGLDSNELSVLVTELVNEGLNGIEAYYPKHDNEFTDFVLKLANEKVIYVTGGTDYHGKNKPNCELGIADGNFKVNDIALELFKE